MPKYGTWTDRSPFRLALPRAWLGAQVLRSVRAWRLLAPCALPRGTMPTTYFVLPAATKGFHVSSPSPHRQTSSSRPLVWPERERQ
ncbi:hypothetical protein B0T26DRAFT_167498 [Lasiosphaeria miniovina]|uniref:Uncharacterized protein n=1 Tax=Lasiosphaeria miniovina TaxID=1954250 RepID=A0AA40B5Z9_9PEZI|nr:uncharacterized protein B0T26DRAFT_167498 [Lasiosphaeria miniovina]KAK0728351.1 hypothetical protein B0T26DRAFT_167498 [Lasiosphaeria miniovina]